MSGEDLRIVQHWLYLNRKRLGIEVPPQSDPRFNQMAKGLITLYQEGYERGRTDGWRQGARDGFQRG